jgi:serine/threonine protein kinase
MTAPSNSFPPSRSSRAEQLSAQALFREALDRTGPERELFLDHACSGDPALRAEVVRLLAIALGPAVEFKAPPLETLATNPVNADIVTAVRAGMQVGAFTLVREIGSGGMGAVWLAKRTDDFEQSVAIKWLHAGLSATSRQRFFRERSTLAKLEHPGIARILDGGTTDQSGAARSAVDKDQSQAARSAVDKDQSQAARSALDKDQSQAARSAVDQDESQAARSAVDQDQSQAARSALDQHDSKTSGTADWFAMEYVDGEPLQQFVARAQPPLRQRIELICTLCDAVSFAHQNLVVHRDLKPSNVMIDRNGQPRLLDFGVAKLLDEQDQTQSRAPMTFAYAAPEQIKGQAISTATDVYALGVMLYELLTGERPHKIDGENNLSLLQAITDTDATAPSAALRNNPRADHPVAAHALKGDLDTIVLKALNREPQRRYLTVAALQEDLQRFLSHLPIKARKDTLRYRSLKWLRRNRALSAALAVSLAVIGVLSVAAWQQWRDALEGRRVQSQISAHYLSVLVTVMNTGDQLTPERFTQYAMDARLANSDLRPEAKLQIMLTTLEAGMISNNTETTRQVFAAIEPLLANASAADRRRFELVQTQFRVKTQAVQGTSFSALSGLGMSPFTVKVIAARMQANRGNYVEAMSSVREAVSLVEAAKETDMIRAVVLANAAQIAFDAGQFSYALDYAAGATTQVTDQGFQATQAMRSMKMMVPAVALLRGLPEQAEPALTKLADNVGTASRAEQLNLQGSLRVLQAVRSGTQGDLAEWFEQTQRQLCRAESPPQTCVDIKQIRFFNAIANEPEPAALKLATQPELCPARAGECIIAQAIAAGATDASLEQSINAFKLPNPPRRAYHLLTTWLLLRDGLAKRNRMDLAAMAQAKAQTLRNDLELPADSVFHAWLAQR